MRYYVNMILALLTCHVQPEIQEEEQVEDHPIEYTQVLKDRGNSIFCQSLSL